METWDLIFRGISAGAALITACGVVLAVLQLRFHAWLKAQDIFTDKEFVQARTNLFKKSNDYAGPLDDQDYIVCRRMDELARLAPYLPKRKIVNTWYNPIRKAWQKLAKAIQIERDTVGWQRKWDAFEGAAKKSIDRLKKT